MTNLPRQFSAKKMPWWNRANSIKSKGIVMEKTVQHAYGQPGSMEYILRSLFAKSVDGMVKMAPGTAKRILEELNFPGQRNIDGRRVYSHAHAIVKGDWIESYPIHFAALPDGRIWLVDGQHRLKAISEQQSPVGISVRIVDMESEREARNFYAGFDGKNSVRTNVQILDAIGIAKEIGLTNRMARAVFEAAPLLMNNFEPAAGTPSGKNNPEMFLQHCRLAVVTEWAKQAKEFGDITAKADKNLYEKLKKTGPVSIGLYTLRHQPARAREFWTGIANNDGLRRGDPRHTFIQDIQSRDIGAGSIRQRVQQSALAWNAFCEGRDLKIIKCVTGAPITLWGTPLNGRGSK